MTFRPILLAGAIALSVAAPAHADQADPATHAEIVSRVRERIASLLEHRPDAFEAMMHAQFRHTESNGTQRTAREFGDAMRACGPDGLSPDRASVPIPPGGGFSFAAHDIEYESIRVRLVRPDVALVTGEYSNILRRCVMRDGLPVVVTPTEAKPAIFSQTWVSEGGQWLLASHAATVKPVTATAAMPVVPGR